ncbi:hypothetical protein Gohar_007765 [Gossypium harknessii]|uniref:DUF7745 domain-containing protein n=1 Tax=Gossypium harknessii TaxID=34285 RepID=A0A7J9GHJ3_9ROSI|nr:hypothetical protein [Gossypium harknessii]
MSGQWVTARIKQKGESKCIPWKSLHDLILAHPDMKKKVDVFALSIYGLMIFPRTLGYIDEAVTDLFDQLDKRVTPILSILAEIFRSLNACRSAAPWMVPNEILYRCGDFNLVTLLGIWGAVGYAPLLVLKQYRSRQFVPTTQGLAQCEFSYKDNGYKKKIREMTNAWKQIHRMKRFTVGPMVTPEYSGWLSNRINDNIPKPSQEGVRSMEEYLQERLETENLRKGKTKAEEDLGSLKTDYKKLRLSMRTAGLGKLQSSGVKRFVKKKIRLMDGQGNPKRSRHEMRL